jgi:uncharacterized protein involved in exopolysaccharide biosynthesis
MPAQTRPPADIHLADIETYGLPALFAVLFRHRRPLVAAVLLAVVAAVAYWRLAPPVYRAETQFLPSAKMLGDDDAGRAGALASAALSLGVSVSGGKADPALLYLDVLKSRSLLEAALLARFRDSNGDSVVALDALAIKGRTEAERLAKGERILRRKVMRTTADVRTGLIKLSIAAHDPVVAAGLANFFVTQVDSFNQRVKAGSAGRQVTFIAERLDVVAANLRDAEQVLERFRSANRSLTSSPELRLQEERLQRDVRLNEQLYITLRTEWEMARIEEFKRFPAILSVDAAIPPSCRESPRLGRTLILFVLLAFSLAVASILVVDFVTSSGNHPLIAEMQQGMAEDRRRFRLGGRR